MPSAPRAPPSNITVAPPSGTEVGLSSEKPVIWYWAPVPHYFQKDCLLSHRAEHTSLNRIISG